MAKPKSRVVILDANEDVTSKGPLFKKAWAERYKGLVEYHPSYAATGVDVATNTVKSDFNDDVRYDVLNLIPPMRAGEIAWRHGLANINKRWCEVDFLSFESAVEKNIHVLGDSIQGAAAMPKSAHMANQHGKTCATAVIALLGGESPTPLPHYNNTCYSFVNDTEAMHVASVHQYDAQKRTMLPVAGAGGTSKAASAIEGQFAQAWARGIWADTLD
jgi:NADPH-dependent 2,4-dienoyl-CoA reductase/sulfur reductase-like enzyme